MSPATLPNNSLPRRKVRGIVSVPVAKEETQHSGQDREPPLPSLDTNRPKGHPLTEVERNEQGGDGQDPEPSDQIHLPRRTPALPPFHLLSRRSLPGFRVTGDGAQFNAESFCFQTC